MWSWQPDVGPQDYCRGFGFRVSFLQKNWTSRVSLPEVLQKESYPVGVLVGAWSSAELLSAVFEILTPATN